MQSCVLCRLCRCDASPMPRLTLFERLSETHRCMPDGSENMCCMHVILVGLQVPGGTWHGWGWTTTTTVELRPNQTA